MQLRQAILQIDQRSYDLRPNRPNSFEEIFVDFQQAPPEQGGGERYHIFLHPKQDVVVQRLELQFEVATRPDDRFLANGYQSASESRLLRVSDCWPRLRSFAPRHLGLSGDAHIPNIPRGPGQLHAWTYTYFQPATGGNCPFFGSLNEKTGFTLLLYDQAKGIVTVRKDLAGLHLSHSFPALDLWVGQGSETEVFDRYFQAMELPRPTAPPALGWAHTRPWSAEKIRQDLEMLTQTPLSTDPQPAFFQIGEGWPTAVGDWQSISPVFPQGLARVAGDIRAKGWSPGLWLAPFVAAKNSELVKKHPDWLLKDKKGRPVKAGWNLAWGGWYFALDFYNGGVRDYLSGVFHLITEKWGYDLLQLDLLYAVCLAPPPGKTRGAVMSEAMEFLRRQVGTKRLLAGGAPLGSCFGWVDYCGVGTDIQGSWEHRWPAWLRHRERGSYLASLRSALGRWQLNGRAFQYAAGSYILGEKEQSMSPVQQHTVLILNMLLGNLHATSDDLSQYSPEQMAELEGALQWRGSQVQAVKEVENDVYTIQFRQENEPFTAFCNLGRKARSFSLAGDKNANGRIGIQPFETMVLQGILEIESGGF